MNAQRYSRQILMPEFGEAGQQKLLNAKVLVVGAGGLGSPVLYYLTAAGVGTIGIVEDDVVSLSNLQRQILFTSDEIGKPKITQAEQRLKALNPDVNFQLFGERLNSKNALQIIENFDIVVDATDNFPTRYLINDACVLLKKPFVFGAIHRFEGQVSVLNVNGSATYRDIFPTPPPPEMAPNCAEAGVLGVMAGLIGSYQVLETIKFLTGLGDLLTNKLMLIDALSGQSRTIKVKPIPDSPKITKLIDYEEFCGVKEEPNAFQEIGFEEFTRWKNEQKDFQLIDVRETHEYILGNLGGENMPLTILSVFTKEISRTKPVIVHCQAGSRSKKAIQFLRETHGFTNLINLKGGMEAAL
ncbi:MAG: molybdopterin-synthase adenylyltransferase MoeB [Spirosomaceae bacterium]|nr:molybdopterin-synthase adenylyltransferase MoeB [Spirosomataceae bacterium]